MKDVDYLIVGSGCSGAMSAQTLVEAGVKVTMIDVGTRGKNLESSIPNQDYLSLRRSDINQYKYFIGENGEGINWESISKGAQVTPPRSYITDLTDKYLPIESSSFSPLESLSYGGLGVGWGLQCWEYSDADLKETGLDPSRMRAAYETVARRIGISATKDNAAKYTIGQLKSYQPSAKADRNHEYILNKYKNHSKAFEHNKAFIGRTPLALITKDFNNRMAYQYHDMDFYSNNGYSAWRPYITIDELRKKSNFTYIGSKLVISFKEEDNHVTVNSIDVHTGEKLVIRCRHLMLASGAIESARITMRSLGNDKSRVPILSNPHSYIPCLQPAMMGKNCESQKLGFGQLSYFIDDVGLDAGLSVATSYSYQSLMLFRIVSQLPFNFFDSRILSRYISTGLVIMIVQHPDRLSPAKVLQLKPSPTSPTGDKLHASFAITDQENATWNKREKQYMSIMRRLNTYPIKRVRPGHGSSIHYAGTIPYGKKNKEFSLDSTGRLHGTRHIYIADSSGFNFLPAKGLTFSLMANAHITAQNSLRDR